MSDYIPRPERQLKDFALNFAALIVANPDTYALLPADGAVINAAAQDYATKFGLASNVDSRTRASIVEKNDARETLIPILRGYAMQIKANRSVADAAKVNLGLRLPDLLRTPVTAPQTRPVISIVRVDALQHKLSFADVSTPDTRARPAGVEGLQLFCHVADAPPADPMAGRFQALVTRQTLAMTFQPADVGKTAFYYARWYTRTGLTGPWSLAASMTVAGA